GGKLAGGLYGVSLGKCFFGESMFHLKTDASKVALATLVEKLKSWEFHFIDSQMTTEHMLSLGAKELPRRIFLKRLQLALRYPTRRWRWRADSSLVCRLATFNAHLCSRPFNILHESYEETLRWVLKNEQN